MRKNRSYDWVYGDTYVPQPGDYLNRRHDGEGEKDNGHSMMMVDWDASTGEADTIDGPWNINFRLVDVEELEQSGEKDFCVGRIPFNDSSSGGESAALADPPLPLTTEFPKGS